jgi:6-pyruvoyltetrahydropterin/6-carboxytetrahydropterin synthase
MLLLTKRFYLHALHNLNNPDWSDEENLKVFGKCYRLHGHDFKIEVTFKEEPDPHTGFIIHPDELDTKVHEKIIAPYHGRNLNELLANPSGEGLSIALYEILKKEFGEKLHCVSVNETLKNYFRYPPTEAILY